MRGNFNGDAFDDLAIEATEPEGIGVRANVIVMLWVGSNSGCSSSARTSSPSTTPVREATAWVRGHIEMTLAAGDFSGDGADDLAVGPAIRRRLWASGQSVIDGGTVTIMRGIVGSVTTGGIVIAGATGLTELNATSIPYQASISAPRSRPATSMVTAGRPRRGHT